MFSKTKQKTDLKYLGYPTKNRLFHFHKYFQIPIHIQNIHASDKINISTHLTYLGDPLSKQKQLSSVIQYFEIT